MIQANELRIGNYLKTPEGLFISVKTLKQADDDILVRERNGMFTLGYTAFPIPLTEDILLKCGFQGSNSSIFTKMDIGPIYFSKPYIESSHYLIKAISGDKITSVKHLHQLQNLYFALTGKELKVKLCP